MSDSTRLLLVKRDFQLEHERLKAASQVGSSLHKRKYILFHKVYSLFLLCINDVDTLFEINERCLLTETFEADIAEFFLLLLNYLFFAEERLTKFAFKSKVFAVARASGLIMSRNKRLGSKLTHTFISALNMSLVRFKLANSGLFASQLLENNDIDLMFNQMASELASSLPWASSNTLIALIYTYSHKLEMTSGVVAAATGRSPNLGIQNQILRLYEHALKLNPKSLQLWSSYFNFVTKLSSSEGSSRITNRILSIYYQSIRSVPLCKVNKRLFFEKKYLFKISFS